MADKLFCCIIAPVGDQGRSVRERADTVFKHIFSPAAAQCGYSAWRADLSLLPGRIPDEVIRHLFDDPIVIADLTGNNGSVAYELAIRHFYRKPAIAVIDMRDSLPFYQSQVRVIRIGHRDAAEIERSVAAISASIRAAADATASMDNPFTEAVKLHETRHSGAGAKGVYLYCIDHGLRQQLEKYLADLGVTTVTPDSRQRRLPTPELMRDIQPQVAAAIVVMHRAVGDLQLHDTVYKFGVAQGALGMSRTIAMLEDGRGGPTYITAYQCDFRRDPLDLRNLRLRLVELGLVREA